jgi:Uma2 family endonuclease
MGTSTSFMTTRATYPQSDGEPMADNTTQFRWIVTLQGGLAALFRDRDEVFVAGDLLWYPVEDRPDIRIAPDVMVVFGRPKGDRGSYMQWQEEGIAPQVVFEILSPSNTPTEMTRKLRFYEQYGVEEYYVYDPYEGAFNGWQRLGKHLVMIAALAQWVSPRLGTRFVLTDGELAVYDPHNRRLLTYEEVEAAWSQAEQRAEQERQRAEQERQRAERLAAQLRALGIEPETE